MRIALDATYSVDPYPSGIAIYSRQLIEGLVRTFPGDEFIGCFRLKQLLAGENHLPSRVARHLLIPPIPTFRADIFHALNQRVDRRPARAVVSTFHDLFVMTADYSSSEFRRRFTQQAREAARRSDMVIAVSQFTASQVCDLLQFDSSRIRVIPHGVDLPRKEHDRTKEKMVLFVGALQVRKNVGRLIKAFGDMPPDWTLVLAGAPHGHGAREILEELKKVNYRERIRVTGYVSSAELEDLYTRASMFAFPSLDEGFGIPVLEAMAHGIPVITSNRSALPEVAGEAALLVNPDSTDELTEELRRLAADEDLRGRLAEAGKKRAAQFSWDRAVRSTYEVYEELAG